MLTTVTRATLVSMLFEQLGLNKREAADMVDRVGGLARIVEIGRDRAEVAKQQSPCPASTREAATGRHPEVASADAQAIEFNIRGNYVFLRTRGVADWALRAIESKG